MRVRFRPLPADDPESVALIAELDELEPGMAELKRMFVRPPHRGRGYGRELLEHLEREARAMGIERLRLETSAALTAAVGLYRAFGFVEIPKFGEYVTSPYSLCMEKRVTPPR